MSPNQVLSITYNIYEILLCATRDFGPRHFRRTTRPPSIEVHPILEDFSVSGNQLLKIPPFKKPIVIRYLESLVSSLEMTEVGKGDILRYQI